MNEEKLIENKKTNVFKIRYVLGRTPYLAFEILYFIYALFTVVFTELFEGERYEVLPFNIIGDYIGFLFSCLLLASLLLFISSKYFNVKINIPILTMCWLLFLGNMIALLCFPSTLTRYNPTNPDFIYYLAPAKRWEYLFMYLNTVIFLYITYACVPKCKAYTSLFKYIAIIFLVVVYFSIIYSYFAESDIYSSLFNGNMSKDDHIVSFFGDKNVFGMVLLLAMIVHFKLLYETRKYFNLLLSIYLYFHIVSSGCKSATLAGIVLFVGYFIILGLEKLKTNKKIAVTIFSLIGLGLILLLLIIFVPAFQKISIFRKLANTITGQFTNNNSTFHSRLLIWQKFFDLVNFSPIYFIFGLGTMNFNFAFLYAKDNNDAMYWHMHNGILEPWGEGGLLRFIINILFFSYIVYVLIKSFIKTKDKRILLYSTFLLAFFVRQLLEPEFLLSSSMLSIVSIIAIVVPILTYYQKIDDPTTLKKVETIPLNKYPFLRLLYILPVSLLACGVMTNNLIYRVAMILLCIILQFIGYFFLIKTKSYLNQDERKFREFSFIIIMDSIIALESTICLFVFKISVAEYIYSVFFAYIFAISLYYYFLEFSYLDDDLKFVRNYEEKYEKAFINDKLKSEKAIFESTTIPIKLEKQEIVNYYNKEDNNEK